MILIHCLDFPLLRLITDPASNGGASLVRCGDIHVGSLVNVFLNIRCKTSAGLGASREMKIALADKRQCTFIGMINIYITHSYNLCVHTYTPLSHLFLLFPLPLEFCSFYFIVSTKSISKCMCAHCCEYFEFISLFFSLSLLSISSSSSLSLSSHTGWWYRVFTARTRKGLSSFEHATSQDDSWNETSSRTQSKRIQVVNKKRSVMTVSISLWVKDYMRHHSMQ